MRSTIRLDIIQFYEYLGGYLVCNGLSQILTTQSDQMFGLMVGGLATYCLPFILDYCSQENDNVEDC